MADQLAFTSSRIRIFQMIALLSGTFLVSLLGEIVFRIFPQWVADPPAPPPYNYRIPDKTLGWYVQEGYRFEGEMRDHAGNPYPVKLTFGKNGFRTYNNPQAEGRKRVLIIGDSYTACAQTSDDKTWHHLLADSLSAEVFAYGAAGFGNTQQVMILQKYIADIRPDLVVWQFCSNDFIDNYWELEKRANYHVRMPRPYTLEDGSTVTRYAAEWPRSVKPWSHFLYWILRRIGQARGSFDAPPAEPAEKLIAEQNEAYPLFARCLLMTDATFKNLKKTLPPDAKILGVCADGFQPQYGHFERLCRDNGFAFADRLPDYLNHFEASECLRTDDGYHWNDRGNQLVAAYLKPRIAALLQ